MQNIGETKWFSLFWYLVLALWMAGVSLIFLGYIALGVIVGLSGSIVSFLVTYVATETSDRLKRRHCERV